MTIATGTSVTFLRTVMGTVREQSGIIVGRVDDTRYTVASNGKAVTRSIHSFITVG